MLAGALLALLWVVLHTLDWLLTIAGARLRAQLADRLAFNGSYELNPVFQKAVDRGSWWSWRFTFSTLIPIPLMIAIAWLVTAGGTLDSLGATMGESTLRFLLGFLVYLHLAIIGIHLQNIALFRRMLRDPDAVRGSISYSRTMTYSISAQRYLAAALFFAAALAIDPRADLAGGLTGLLLLATKQLFTARRLGRAAPASAPAGTTLQ